MATTHVAWQEQGHSCQYPGATAERRLDISCQRQLDQSGWLCRGLYKRNAELRMVFWRLASESQTAQKCFLDRLKGCLPFWRVQIHFLDTLSGQATGLLPCGRFLIRFKETSDLLKNLPGVNVCDCILLKEAPATRLT